MQDNKEDILASKNTADDPLADYVPVACPACGAERSIPRTGRSICDCWQDLNADTDKAGVIREWWRRALSPITARRARAFILDLANMAGSIGMVEGPPSDLTGAE